MNKEELVRSVKVGAALAGAGDKGVEEHDGMEQGRKWDHSSGLWKGRLRPAQDLPARIVMALEIRGSRRAG